MTRGTRNHHAREGRYRKQPFRRPPQSPASYAEHAGSAPETTLAMPPSKGAPNLTTMFSRSGIAASFPVGRRMPVGAADPRQFIIGGRTRPLRFSPPSPRLRPAEVVLWPVVISSAATLTTAACVRGERGDRSDILLGWSRRRSAPDCTLQTRTAPRSLVSSESGIPTQKISWR